MANILSTEKRAQDKSVELIETQHPGHLSPWDQTTVRARLMRVGGREPRARFESGSEVRSFSALLTPEKARDIAQRLYQEMDVDLLVRRNNEDFIVECELLDFVPVSDEDPLAALDHWFAPQAAVWRQIPNVEEYVRSMRDD